MHQVACTAEIRVGLLLVVVGLAERCWGCGGGGGRGGGRGLVGASGDESKCCSGVLGTVVLGLWGAYGCGMDVFSDYRGYVVVYM